MHNCFGSVLTAVIPRMNAEYDAQPFATYVLVLMDKEGVCGTLRIINGLFDSWTNS